MASRKDMPEMGEPSERRLPIAGRPKIKDATRDQIRDAILYVQTSEKWREVREIFNVYFEARGWPGSPDDVKGWAASPEGKALLNEHLKARGEENS